ncbi:TraB/GumN family protein [Paraburkholderia phosphatilytica]|uniref:TraB/GumN family protein n=1 Tax=Paraburkholderia phosphatilytica TaxID=2282883 RepID=UPI0013DF3514|nr:TraB/GumN family protein [Paraburkholderia phosphatilytica]
MNRRAAMLALATLTAWCCAFASVTAHALPPATHHVAAASSAAGPASIDVPLWTATSPGHPTLLLVPTIHRLESDDPRIDAALEKIVARAEAVVFEAPITMTPEQMMPVMRRFGVYPTDDNVTNHVSTMTPEQLASCAREGGIDIVPFLQLKPWLAALSVDFGKRGKHADSKHATGDAGNFGYPGIDQRLLRIATDRKLPVIYLETFERGLQMFADMPADDQAAMLKAGCDDAAGRSTPGDVDLGQLQTAWTAGDIGRLEKLIVKRNPKESDAFYDANQYIFRAGTEIFAASLEQYGYFHGKGPILIAVGTGHFFGSDSLLDRLKAAGYTITPPPENPAVTAATATGKLARR